MQTVIGTDYLSLKLQRLDLLLHREILRLRARYQLSLDEFRGLYTSDEQVDSLINEQPEHTSDGSTTDELTARADELRDAGLPGQENSCWKDLVDKFCLSRLEQDLLLVALGPELDLKYETLYGYLNNDVTRKWPTQDLAIRLLAG